MLRRIELNSSRTLHLHGFPLVFVHADDAVYDELGTGRRIEGVDAIVEVYRAWKHASPDVTGTVTNALGIGNTAVLEIMWQGRQSGELATPTGQMLSAGGKAWKVPAVEWSTLKVESSPSTDTTSA